MGIGGFGVATWLIKTSFPGVRYRKHNSRKHGVEFGQYYTIRYQKLEIGVESVQHHVEDRLPEF